MMFSGPVLRDTVPARLRGKMPDGITHDRPYYRFVEWAATPIIGVEASDAAPPFPHEFSWSDARGGWVFTR